MNKRGWTPNAQKQMWRYGGAWDIDDPYVGLEAIDTYTKQPKIGIIKSKEQESNNGIFWYIVCVLLIVGLLYYMNKN